MPRSSRGESPGQIPTVQDALLSGRDGARPALQPRTRLLQRTLSTPDRPLDIEAEDCLRTDTLGRYPISGRLGAGGMGEVLHVRDDHLGRELAAKVMRSDHAEDPVQLRKFLQEARITGQLEHPNIVPIHELGMTDQKRVFFTMKQIRGRDLAAVLGSAPRPSRIRLLEIFIKICDAISFAHSKGVIHRDL